MAITLTFPPGGALVVGGTGRVGEGVVRQMAAAGVAVVFTYLGSAGRDGEARSARLERELRDAGHDVTRRQMDMSSPESIRAAIDAVVSRSGRLHSVLCASGPVVPFRRMIDFDAAEIEEFFRGDMMAYFRLYQEAARTMRSSGGGSLTGTTTMANWRVVDYDGISATSKAAIDSMTRQVAAEEAVYGIRCNSIAIGWVGPFSIAQFEERLPPDPPASPSTPEEMLHHLIRSNIARARLGRNARPEEAGNLFAFLASDQAAYITGQTIVFDGGMTL